MKGRARYTLIGYVVSKVALPYARRTAKRRIKRSAVDTSRRSVSSMAHHPARTSIAIGSIVGAAAWLVRRRGDDHDPR